MSVIRNESFIKKANDFKKPLKERKVYPVNIAEIASDDNAFQNLKVVPTSDFNLPIKLNSKDKILIDFGDHCIGYLHFALSNIVGARIPDSPLKLRFTFGEFPLEIVTPPEDYNGTLGNCWLQNEEKSVVFIPYSGSLERRYSFRYLLIERIDNAVFPVEITDIFANCVSAVDISDVKTFEIADERLKKIYDISLKTLKECEQDVFEDGPKRDRRLWIGDLRLQALTDYVTFKNYDLVKRCIYLFAGYKTNKNLVAPCVFPDSEPCVDSWTFADYSLFFISCLYDYMNNCDDMDLVKELYDTALEQAKITSEHFNDETGTFSLNPFIDWCPKLDKSVAILGVYIYTLKQLKEIEVKLGKDTDWTVAEIEKMKSVLLSFYSNQQGLFIAPSGQISWHSQVWAVLSNIFTKEKNVKLLKNTQKINPNVIMHTPYMIHYYIEALYNNGLKEDAIDLIKNYWGKIVECGFDCCPEVFNPDNEFESPYLAPEINSACHAWSCTPAYWIYRFYNE